MIDLFVSLFCFWIAQTVFHTVVDRLCGVGPHVTL